MKKIALTITTILLSIISFAQDTIYLQNIRENATELIKEEVPLSFNTNGVSNINVLDSQIMLIAYENPKDGYYYSIYSLKDQKKISDIISAKDKKREMLIPMKTIMKDAILFTSIVNKNYTVIPFKTLYKKNPNYKVINNNIIPPAILYKESIVYIDPLYFEDKSLNLSNGRDSRFIKNPLEESDIEVELKLKEGMYNSASLNNGAFATNGETLIFGNFSYPRIDILESDLSVKKTIMVEEITLKHFIIPEYRLITTAPDSFNGCKAISYSNNGFYVLYHGVFNNGLEYKVNKSYIISLDQDGNYLNCYSCEGEIVSISSEIEENTIYANEKSDTGIKLVKLRINEI